MGRRSLSLILQYGFRVLNLERIYTAHNSNAIRLYENAGFVQDGRLRAHVALDGAYHDLLVKGLLRSEFETPK
jgi:RimJ/RimL family protein N-acetyltransferase